MKHLLISDVQVRPGQDYWFLEAIGNYIVDTKPDVIVCIGDFADMPSLSQYDIGMKSFEGRRYRDDILSTHKAMSTLLSPIEKEKSRLIRNKKRLYSPRMVLTLGNHECVAPDTEILTADGWLPASEVTNETLVGSYSSDGKTLGFEPPIKMTVFEQQPLIRLNGDFREEIVSNQHRIDIDGGLHSISDYVGTKVKQTRLRNSLTLENKGISLTENEIKILTWVVCDATIVHNSAVNKLIQFKLSKERKIKSLTSLLDAAGYKYTIREATMSTHNKLQPYYICLYAEDALRICTLLGGVKQFPESFKNMSREQVLTLLSTLTETDGSNRFARIIWSTTSRHDVDVIQYACFTNGIPFAYKEGQTQSGFANGKLQYYCKIAYVGLCERRYAVVEATGVLGDVVAIQTVRGTLITRRNGKVNFTGNCRINKAVEKDSKLEGTLSISDLSYEEFGWEVVPFLKPVEIDGIFYSHYFCSGVMGRAFTSADRMVKALHSSCVMGHVQDANICITQKRADGSPLLGLFTGLSTIYSEDYLNPQTNMSLRQIWELNDIRNGFAIPTAIPLDYLIKEYL